MRFLLVLLFPIPLLAQFTYRVDQSIPVEIAGKILANPWAGGLNTAQVNTMDLNADGHVDLVIFDKMTSRISTFLASNNTWIYTPEYEVLFPPELATFVLLRDYNCDGKKDLFTFGQIGIYVYQNVTTPGGSLMWKKLTFYTGPGFKSEVLLTKGFSGKINLLPGSNDLPDLKDMDGDGDLDVINMRFVTPGTAEYHKNFSVERYGRCDSLDLERQTQSWGGFEECHCGEMAFGGQSCSDLGGRTNHTGGKSMLTFDMDNDGDRDLLFSEEECSEIYYLENQGDANNAVMNSLEIFPVTHPVGIDLFPASYLEDVDFDGKPDLLASPNVNTRQESSNNFYQSLLFYKNTGTAQQPVFTFVKRDFLQDEMIELGDNSAPAFTDIDQDGDEDMLIGSYLNKNTSGTIAYYENIGSPALPSFKWITDDFIGLSIFNLYNIKPQFGDVDANGGIDLILTATSSMSGRTSLYYVPSSSSTAPVFGGQTLTPLNINIEFNANLTMVDIDQDAHLDLLIGTSSGALQYWRNSGSNSFVLADNSYIGLGDSFDRQYITAVAGDIDADGHDDLVVGNQAGMLSVYSDFRSAGANPQPYIDIVYDVFSDSYKKKNLGGRLRPVIVNLRGTDKPDIVIGNTLGGIQVLKNDNGLPLSEEMVVNLYPNPLPSGTSLSIITDRNTRMEIFTILGQRIGSSLFITGNQTVTYPLQGIAPGIYIARFTTGAKQTAHRFIVL